MSARYTLFRRVAPAELPLYRRARALRAAGEHAALRTIARRCARRGGASSTTVGSTSTI